MDSSDFMPGEELLFSIKVFVPEPAPGQFKHLPVGCITNSPLNLTRERIGRAGRGLGGNKAYRPGMKDYDLSIEGLLSKKPGLVSYNHLKRLYDDGTEFEWQLKSPDGYIAMTGTSFILSLGMNPAAGQWVTFSCTISPGKGGVAPIMVWSQDGFNVVSQDGTNLIQI